MTPSILVMVTCPSVAEAERIGAALVREKLAACVSLVPGLVSIFSWKGKKHRARESLMLVKTRRAKFEELRRRVRALHSYDVPEIVAVPLSAGDPDYLRWVEKETRS